MAEYTVKFSLGGGFKSNAYDKLLTAVNSGALAHSNEWAAEEILMNAKALCPVNTGQLRDSLYIKTTNTPEAAVHNDLAPIHNDLVAKHVDLQPIHQDIGQAQHFDIGQSIHYDLGPMHRVGGRGSAAAFGVTKEIRSDLPYACHVEFGTSDTPARPFIRPAIDMTRDRILNHHIGEVKHLFETL